MGEGYGYKTGLAGYSLARLRERELFLMFTHNCFLGELGVLAVNLCLFWTFVG
jgi:hypothetical protein